MNNAGISAVGTVLEATKEEMDRVYNVNVVGVFWIEVWSEAHVE